MSERVKVVRHGGVAEVRLNRPEKLNALDAAMFDGLIESGTALAADRSVRAIVLCGEGRAFCAGLDFASFMGLASSDRNSSSLLDRPASAVANHAQQAAYVWTSHPVPVIAAVHGVAFGGGLQIALGADIRFIAPDAQLSVMEIKWGLIPDMSGTQSLRHLVRLDVAKELTFTGRIVYGSEAVDLGLATHAATDPFGEAMALAREIASKSPNAVRAGKRLLNRAGVVGVEEGLRLEEQLQLTLVGTPNQMEAVRANMQKCAPEFRDPEA